MENVLPYKPGAPYFPEKALRDETSLRFSPLETDHPSVIEGNGQTTVDKISGEIVKFVRPIAVFV